MLRAAICDDEQEFVLQLCSLLERYSAETGEEIKVSVYHDGLELIEQYDPATDLIFLDIQMEHINGFQAAEQIRKKDENVGIIFLTSFGQYALDGYRYHAVNYIVKPMKYIRLKVELNRFRERYQRKNPYIVVRNDQGSYKVELHTLHYAETYKRNLLLHTDETEIVCYKNMKELEAELEDYGFFRCHTGFLVNLAFVKRVEKLEAWLTTGEAVYISKPKKKEFMKALAGYWGENAVSMDVRMVMLDVLCTFWEGAMIAWLLHLFAKKKISLKMDLVIVCIFVLAAESMTFTGMNVVVKLILTMSSNVAGAKLCCKSSVRVSEILLAHAVVTFAIASMEMCVSTVCELIEIEHKYHGIPYIFHVGYWYLVMHLLANIVVVLLKKFLLKIHASMSAREKLVLFLSLFSISLLLCGLMAYPTKNQVFNKIGVIAGIAVLTVAFFSLVLYFNESIQARLRRQQEKHEWMQMQAQYQYYQERLEQEQRVRRMYHDMKNHLLVLQSQIAKLSDAQEGEKEKTAQMIASLRSQIFDYENFEKTGNAFLDVIVRDKMRAAKDKEIDVQIDVDISKAVDLDGLDISTIFGNALDNALEACEKVEKEERFLTFRSGVRNGYQVFQIENAAAEEGADGKTSKEDTYLHGFGLQNIKRAVEKYEGACQYQCQDGVFSLHILLPLKDPYFSEK